jgi:hypothetical protein
VIRETDLKLADGRTLHCYDSGEAALDWLVAHA